MGDRMGMGRGLRSALSTRRRQKRRRALLESDDGELELGLRLRRALRLMLREPGRPWPVREILWVSLMNPVRLQEAVDMLCKAAMAEVIWHDGVRCVRLSEYGLQEVPGLLADRRSQALVMILLRDGPRAARFTWAVRRRRRLWRRELEARERAEGESRWWG